MLLQARKIILLQLINVNICNIFHILITFLRNIPDNKKKALLKIWNPKQKIWKNIGEKLEINSPMQNAVHNRSCIWFCIQYSIFSYLLSLDSLLLIDGNLWLFIGLISFADVNSFNTFLLILVAKIPVDLLSLIFPLQLLRFEIIGIVVFGNKNNKSTIWWTSKVMPV